MGNITKVSKTKMDELLNKYNVYTNTYDAQNGENAVKKVNTKWWGDDGKELEIDLDTGLVYETQEDGKKVGMGALGSDAIKQIQTEKDNANRLRNRELDKMLQDDKNAGGYDKGPKKEESKGEILRSNSVNQNKTDITFDVNDFLINKKSHSTGSPKDGNYGKYDNETVIGNTINSQLTSEQKQQNAQELFGSSYIFDGRDNLHTSESNHVGLGSLGEPITPSVSTSSTVSNINNSTHVGLGSLGEPIPSQNNSTVSNASSGINSQSISGVSQQFGKFDTTTPIGQAINNNDIGNSMFDVNRDFNINNK